MVVSTIGYHHHHRHGHGWNPAQGMGKLPRSESRNGTRRTEQSTNVPRGTMRRSMKMDQHERIKARIAVLGHMKRWIIERGATHATAQMIREVCDMESSIAGHIIMEMPSDVRAARKEMLESLAEVADDGTVDQGMCDVLLSIEHEALRRAGGGEVPGVDVTKPPGDINKNLDRASRLARMGVMGILGAEGLEELLGLMHGVHSVEVTDHEVADDADLPESGELDRAALSKILRAAIAVLGAVKKEEGDDVH